MRTGDYFTGNSLRQMVSNAKGKIFTQFMSDDLGKKNPSRMKTFNEELRMEGYDVNIRKPGIHRIDIQQPTAGHGEFWLG